MKTGRNTAFVSIGSNLGDARRQCLKAIEQMDAADLLSIKRASSLYTTSPWGVTSQPWFVNAAAEVETGLDVFAFLSCLQHIEKKAGRVRTRKWGPRIIDLDIVFFNDAVISLPGLSVPHPLMQRRRFVLAPVAEIAPRFVHPVLKKPLQVLLQELHDKGSVEKIS